MRLIHIDHHSPEGIVYTSESLRELCQDTMEGIEEELPRAVTRLLQAGTVTAAEGN